jgi:hypothetical protein
LIGAGDVTHRQRGAAARVAVELGQHHAGQRQRVVERLGGVDGILAEHRIDHEQRFGGLQFGVQRGDLLHHRLVDTQTAGRIDDQHVVVVLARPVERGARDVDRLLVGLRREEIAPTCSDTVLSWAIAAGDTRRTRPSAPSFLVFLQPLGQLARGGGLAGALQAGHQDDGGRLDVQVQFVDFGRQRLHRRR